MSVSASLEELNNLKAMGKTSRTIYSFFPCDRHDCPCQDKIIEIKNKFSGMTAAQIETYRNAIGVYRCEKDGDYKPYDLICNACDEKVAEVFATDESCDDFHDLHYINTSRLVKIPMRDIDIVSKEGKFVKKQKVFDEGCEWVGALAINISPINGQLGIECSCGADSRDFRANTTLSEDERRKLIEKSGKKPSIGKTGWFKAVPRIVS